MSATNRIEWESHYDAGLPLVGFENFNRIDLGSPYVRRLALLGAAATRSLEFGSGKGGLSLTLKRQQPHVEAHLIDFSPSAVRFSRALFDHFGVAGHFHVGSFLELPFPDDHFDLVHGNTVLEHVEDTAAAVRELSRVLAPGGVAIITVPNRRRRYDHDLYHFVSEFRYFSRTFFPAELDAIWEAHDCEVVDRFGSGLVYLFPTFLPMLVRAEMRRRRRTDDRDGRERTGEGPLPTPPSAQTPVSSHTRRAVRRAASAADAAWGTPQAWLNRVTTNRELLPQSWYITIGIVARKLV